MGLTERHWFEDEEPKLTDEQLEDIVYEKKKVHDQDAIVRCKYCALRFTKKCPLHDQAFPINKGDNWFCADGAQKEGR